MRSNGTTQDTLVGIKDAAADRCIWSRGAAFVTLTLFSGMNDFNGFPARTNEPRHTTSRARRARRAADHVHDWGHDQILLWDRTQHICKPKEQDIFAQSSILLSLSLSLWSFVIWYCKNAAALSLALLLSLSLTRPLARIRKGVNQSSQFSCFLAEFFICVQSELISFLFYLLCLR